MVGSGRGTWQRRHRKPTVEESLSISIADLFGGSRLRGGFRWAWSTGVEFTVQYEIDWSGGLPAVTLRYWARHGEIVIPIGTQTTPVHFGGERLWLTCPLISNDVACKRRISKLHLPRGARYFGCRTCHGLTYESCQTAHRAARGIADLV